MTDVLDLDDYDFALPPEQIAQQPPAERDGGRLLQLDRQSGAIAHGNVRDLPSLLTPNDLLVINTTRVVRARLRGRKDSGGAAEALLLGESASGTRYRALLRTSGRQRVGQKLHFTRADVSREAEIQAIQADGSVELAFSGSASPYTLGEMPLPPYIQRQEACVEDEERYQTTFADAPGSVAAPTAGLHLSERLLREIEATGASRAEVILHVGVGTFRPIGAEDLARGHLHTENYVLPETTVEAIRQTRERGGRVCAVGTTTARVLESCVDAEGELTPSAGETQLFLQPGATFRVVDALLTNFHLPRSSLLLLVAAFAGREPVLEAYAAAIESGYRFFSYGDAMWIS